MTSSSPQTRRRLVAIFAAFALTRLAVLAVVDADIPTGDEPQYIRSALSVVRGGISGYLAPDYVIEKGTYYPYFPFDITRPDGPYNPVFWDPLYPAFVGLVYGTSGGSKAAVRGAQVLLSLATLALGMATLRRAFPGRPGLAVGFGWAFVAYLPFAGYAAKHLTETLDAFVLTLLLWVGAGLSRGSPRRLLAFGLLAGAYVLVKSYWLALLPLWLIVAVWPDRGTARPAPRVLAGRAALVVLGIGLALSPTLLRNYRATDGHLVISTKNTWNLWKDNNDFLVVIYDWRETRHKVHRWLQRYYELGAVHRVPRDLEDVYDPVANPRVRPPCDEELDRLQACEVKGALSFLARSPAGFLRRALEKNAALWSPNNYVFNRAPPGPAAWNQNYRVELPGALRWTLQIWVLVAYLLAMAGFIVGITLPAENPEQQRLRALVALALVFLVFVVVPWGHGVTRFRLPFMVPILMFAVLGLSRVREVGWWPARDASDRGARIARCAMATAFLAVCAVKLPLVLAP